MKIDNEIEQMGVNLGYKVRVKEILQQKRNKEAQVNCFNYLKNFLTEKLTL